MRVHGSISILSGAAIVAAVFGLFMILAVSIPALRADAAFFGSLAAGVLSLAIAAFIRGSMVPAMRKKAVHSVHRRSDDWY